MAASNTIYPAYNSALSLRPLVAVLKKMIAEGKPGAKRLYQSLINDVESKPELLQPLSDASRLASEAELAETLFSTIFPPSTTSTQGIYALSFPFQPDMVHASPGFKELFLSDRSSHINFLDTDADSDIGRALRSLAYNLILKKIYHHAVPLTATAIYPFEGADGLKYFYEVTFDAQFVDVRNSQEQSDLPAEFPPQLGSDLDELSAALPLGQFQFEGLMVIEVHDITQEQVIVEIKTALLNINSFSDVTVYDELQQHVQSLIGLKRVQIGITPFFKMNGYYLYTETLYKNSLLFKSEEVIRDKDSVSALCKEVFELEQQPILYEILNEASTVQNRLLKYYYEQGAKSLILCPLYSDSGALIGLLEIMSLKTGQLQFQHLARIQPAISLFTLALEKSGESLELQIDKTIKEHFTAIQSAVEWKFTEAAFSYLQNRQVSELAKMENIRFDDVYPLYAAIDVRNSSTQRNHAIQLDLLEQLNMARSVLEKAEKVIHFPLLVETRFRIEKYIYSVSDTLLSDDELLVYDFLQHDLDSIFKNLRSNRPELKKWIDDYFRALDPQRGVIYHHRRDYEESITRINDVLDRFIDNEQHEAQEIYPHYFERYLTDGLEFNIYIGQSLSPQYPFNEMYVRNLKLWQLTMLARAARITQALEKRLSLPLQTTQLVLAHSIPLSISFRRKERKFDVDGAYNIRYEIVKKRIDKVHIKDTDERLTQPGKVAIVYSQHREMEEYLEFIEFLQHEGLLGEAVEHLDLEDTQGISGLKAIRVNVLQNTEPVQKAPSVTRKEQMKSGSGG